ncbi:MAG: rRNA maturation RNase YbeY [Porticoccaceae bacterium]
MSIRIAIDNACDSGAAVPAPASLRRWLRAALRHLGRSDAQVAIRIVGEAEGSELYARYRLREPSAHPATRSRATRPRATRPHATNVLSFPADLPEWVELPLLGDIVICAPVVAREAADQRKAADAHWAHMVVHGTLHLLGHDHQDDAEADRMEALETEILVGLHFPPPYAVAPALAVNPS